MYISCTCICISCTCISCTQLQHVFSYPFVLYSMLLFIGYQSINPSLDQSMATYICLYVLSYSYVSMFVNENQPFCVLDLHASACYMYMYINILCEQPMKLPIQKHYH